MKTSRRAAAAAAVLALSLAAVGCGGSDDNDFKEDYNAAVKPLTELNDDIGSSLGGSSGKSNKEIAGEFENLADKAEQTRDNLADLEPPEDAQEEFDNLLDALKSGTDDLSAVADAARGGDPAKAAKAAQALVESGSEIQKAETALQQAVDG